MATANIVAAQSGPVLSTEREAWQFPTGAWRKVRVVTESLDELGNVASTSTTETSTLLCGVMKESYDLQVEVAVEVAGKRFEAEPQLVSQKTSPDKPAGQPPTQVAHRATITVDDKPIPCQVFEYATSEDGKKLQHKVYYSESSTPSVLGRETIATTVSGDTQLYETVESVVAMDMPTTVLDRTVSAYHLKTTRTSPQGTTITMAVHSDEVPGGIISHTSKELDAAGRTIRRSTLEVTDYGLEPDRRIFPRRFSGRRRRR